MASRFAAVTSEEIIQINFCGPYYLTVLVYSYFKKRCQKKSKHPISQDRKVVWVVSNRSSLPQSRTTSAKNELTPYVRTPRYPKVFYFVYLCQSYYETESRTHRQM